MGFGVENHHVRLPGDGDLARPLGAVEGPDGHVPLHRLNVSQVTVNYYNILARGIDLHVHVCMVDNDNMCRAIRVNKRISVASY